MLYDFSKNEVIYYVESLTWHMLYDLVTLLRLQEGVLQEH